MRPLLKKPSLDIVIWTTIDQFQTSTFCLKQLNDSLTPISTPTQRTAHYYTPPILRLLRREQLTTTLHQSSDYYAQHSTQTALVHLYNDTVETVDRGEVGALVLL